MSYQLPSNSRPIPPFTNAGHFPAYPVTQPFVPRTLPQTPGQPSKPIAPLPGPSSFKAPAHKHAHHLHSIPPREKSTRTLIIDHMLWVHARTRFAQARAELGMTDRTGGPSSSNYSYRERPEQFEEDDEVASEGEDVAMLEVREGGPGGTHHDDEEERRQKQDLVLARNLRLRAISLEKVVTSMLEQPPPVHYPVLDDELATPPTSPKRGSKSHPHTLPNGVRLRLALGTVINDLFARQAPVSPYRHHHHPPPIIVSANSDQSSSECFSPTNSPVVQHASPNPSVGTSVNSSSCSARAMGPLPPPLTLLSSVSPPASKRSFPRLTAQVPQPLLTMPLHQNITISSRARTMYMEGADHSTTNASPGLRCPRHLNAGCEICIEAKQSSKAPASIGRARGVSGTGGLSAFGNGTGSRMSSSAGKNMCVTGWQDGSGIGTGLAQPGINGSALRRKSRWTISDGEHDQPGNLGDALVSVELGREVGEEAFGAPDNEPSETRTAEETSMPTPVSPSTMPPRRPRSEAEGPPLPPSREWYMLLAGLLTRAALEGYLADGWHGTDAAECLLLIGRGHNDRVEISEGEDLGDSPFEWFDPDDLPGLKEATRILFPSLRGTSGGVSLRRDSAECAFHIEMETRIRRFLDIPQQTPDLATHMEDLAWHYPAEPVERSAVRFCEAVAKWRGKPELETYKKKTKDQAPLGVANMPMESFVRSNPTSPTTGNFVVQPNVPSLPQRPSIEKYFIIPEALTPGRNKRRRSFEDVERSFKRVH
ncbi:hypothetical protein ID866_1972 [Astraeus odoratus]|nr:hypothetical protein ID866_1972 [Astraeus odoratus]